MHKAVLLNLSKVALVQFFYFLWPMLLTLVEWLWSLEPHQTWWHSKHLTLQLLSQHGWALHVSLVTYSLI